jgi:3-mercaptopyruvate sulfurtransferase SseA
MFDRTDGVSVIPKAVLSGEMMDGAFMMYDIDPVNDMILIVAGGAPKAKGMAENAAATARFAWSMKYWGLKHYAVLDGNIQYMLNSETNPKVKSSLDDLFVAKPSKPSMSGTHSIKEIKCMNQDIMATLTEMIDVVKNSPTKAFIVDSRSANEYNANNSVKKSKTEAKICGEDHNSQCYTAIEGHIKGAKHIEYTDFIIRNDATKDTNRDGKVDELDASYRYKSQAVMLDLLKQNGFDSKTQTLYTYCRTGTRAALPAFIGTDILHIDTKLFDGSWIEWGRLAGKKGTIDVNGAPLLNEDSPWRTDLAELTEKLTYNPSNLVAPRVREGSTLEADQYACDADKIKRDDSNYIK